MSLNLSEEQLDDKPTDSAGQTRCMCVHARSLGTALRVPPLSPEPEFQPFEVILSIDHNTILRPCRRPGRRRSRRRSIAVIVVIVVTFKSSDAVESITNLLTDERPHAAAKSPSWRATLR